MDLQGHVVPFANTYLSLGLPRENVLFFVLSYVFLRAVFFKWSHATSSVYINKEMGSEMLKLMKTDNNFQKN